MEQVRILIRIAVLIGTCVLKLFTLVEFMDAFIKYSLLHKDNGNSGTCYKESRAPLLCP